MADAETAEDTQAVSLSPAPAVEAPADDFDKDRAMATIQKLRAFEKEAKAKIARLAELEAAEQERAAADLSESEKLKKKLADVEAREAAAISRLNAELVKSAAHAAAVSLQLPFASMDALADAVALGAFSSLEIGDDGKIPGLNDAIKGLHKARPYLFGTAQPNAPDINAGARGNGSAPLITEEDRQRATAHYRHTF